MIQVDIKSLKSGIHEFEWTPAAVELGLDPDIFKDLHVEAFGLIFIPPEYL